MLEVLIIAILGAAVLADQKDAPPAPPGALPEPPELEAMRLLGIGQPDLNPTEKAFGEMEKFPPWTLEQITSFQQGRLMCPSGHTKGFSHLELDFVRRNIPDPHTKTGTLPIEGMTEHPDTGPGLRAFLVCETRGCHQEFWFPSEWITADFF